MKLSDILLRIFITVMIFAYFTIKTVLEDRRERLKIEESEKESDVIKVKLDEKMIKRIEKYSELRGMSQDQVIDAALREFLMVL